MTAQIAVLDEILASRCRVRDHFTKQPIYRDTHHHPTAYFGVTDFTTPLDAGVIEDMADCIHAVAPPCDIIVSIADHSSGALTQSLSLRRKVPYTLANWYPTGSLGEIPIDHHADGVMYLNGLRRGMHALLVMDVLRTGRTATKLLHGVLEASCNVVGLSIGCEILVGFEGRVALEGCGVQQAIVSIYLRGEATKEAPGQDGQKLPATSNLTLKRPMVSSLKLIKNLNSIEVQVRYERIAKSFLNVAIHHNPQHHAYPYCSFTLTDFTPPLLACLVEDMADLCVYYGDFTRCDVIVAEADRGGGPLVQAVAQRTGLPYVLTNCYPSGEGVGATSHVEGFSGSGSIVVSGIKAEDRCIFVDDVLSTGGTTEGVLRGIVQHGGLPMEGIFIAEKLYPPRKVGGIPTRRGKDHLLSLFPYFDVTTIVQYVAEGEFTNTYGTRVGCCYR